METGLATNFNEKLFATIFSFQLRQVGLPKAFEDAIQETEVMKQDLKVAEAEQQSTKVSLETELMQAKRRTQVKANMANATAEALLLANGADIAQFTANQEKSADSLAAMLKQLDGNQQDLLNYMEVRALRDHPSAKSMVGLTLDHGPG